MLSRIPSWVVAVTGAATVIVATATSSILLQQTKAAIQEAKSKVTDIRSKKDLAWSSHLLADQRSTAADVFIAEALGGSSNAPFLLNQATLQIRGAVMAMWAATDEEMPDESPEWLQILEAALLEGNLPAYTGLKSEINKLRLRSQSYVNQLATDIRSAESRIESLETQEYSVYMAYVFFNLIGLIIAMCKDLPLWRS